MAVNRRVTPYPLDPAFERSLIALLCQRPKLFARVGRALDPEALNDEHGKILLRAAQSLAQEFGMGPDSTITVAQRLRKFWDDGRIREEQIFKCLDYLDAAEDKGLPDEEHVAQGIIPILRERAQVKVMDEIDDALGKRKDIRTAVEALQRATHLGDSSDSAGIKLGGGSFEAIRRIRGLERLPIDVPEIDTLLEGGLWRKALGIVIAPSGWGKCHAKGQGILMADGIIKKVENIVVGDRLVSPHGDFRTVLMTNRGRGEMVEIRPHKGDSWRVNMDHILTVSPYGNQPAIDVSVKEFLRWSKWKRTNTMLIRSQAEFLPVKQLPLDPYLLGVILGDGSSVADSLTVTTADREIKEFLQKSASEFGLSTVFVGKRGKANTYRLSGKQGVKNPILSALAALRLRRKASVDKFVPQQYLTASIQARLEILAGLLDTDGYYKGRNCGFDFISKSKQLASDVVFLARSVGVAAYMKACSKRCVNTDTWGTYYRVQITGEVSKIPCRVKRKKATCENRRLDALKTRFEVVPVGEDDFYGFTLDGDGRYLLDDFTVTHNSIYLSHQTASAMRANRFVALATLELPEPIIIARIKANLLGFTIDEILNGSLEKAEQKFMALAPSLGSCVVKEFAPKATTIHDIFAWVKDLEAEEGKKIDLLVVDYADKLGTGRADDNSYVTGGTVFEGLRHYSVERDIWCWTASQPKRMTKGQKRIELDDIADSINKARVADLVVTMNPKGDGDLLSYYLAKNRMGKTGKTIDDLPQEFEYGRIAPTTRDEDFGISDELYDY